MPQMWGVYHDPTPSTETLLHWHVSPPPFLKNTCDWFGCKAGARSPLTYGRVQRSGQHNACCARTVKKNSPCGAGSHTGWGKLATDACARVAFKAEIHKHRVHGTPA